MEQLEAILAQKRNNTDALVAKLRRNVVGSDARYTTPLGLPRRMVYCDYFASGRSLRFVEDTIRDHVLPFYANTHTTTTESARRTTLQRERAREVIRSAVNATRPPPPADADAAVASDDPGARTVDPGDYCVIFTGSGSTSAILHMVHTLRLNDEAYWTKRYGDLRVKVFVSIAEHHSNLLPWRESYCDVVTIPMDPATGDREPDLAVLDRELRKAAAAGAPLMVGSFSAGSNLTGIPIDTHRVARVLHRHGALAFFDYAGVGAYVKIDMRAGPEADLSPDDPDRGLGYKDAVFLSPHKFIGGPGTPGVLVARAALFAAHSTPARPGGGTVTFVTDTATEYHAHNLEEREEAGTPAIVESIRCGMVFAIKDAVGAEHLEARELAIAKSVLARLTAHPNIRVLGDTDGPRVPVFCLQIRAGQPLAPSSGTTTPPRGGCARPGLLLHHNFVSALLNDLFGIQTRGGCMCAGPYGQSLLKARAEEKTIFRAMLSDNDLLRSSAFDLATNSNDALARARSGTLRVGASNDALSSSSCATGMCVSTTNLLAPTLRATAGSPATRSTASLSPSPVSPPAMRRGNSASSLIVPTSPQRSGCSPTTPTTPGGTPVPRMNVMKPGFLRFSFNYFTDPAEVEYVVSAVEWVATHGAALLPYYVVDAASGSWKPRAGALPVPISLHDVASPPSPTSPIDPAGSPSSPLAKWWSSTKNPNAHALDDARRLTKPKHLVAACTAHGDAMRGELQAGILDVSAKIAGMRWFAHPADVADAIAAAYPNGVGVNGGADSMPGTPKSAKSDRRMLFKAAVAPQGQQPQKSSGLLVQVSVADGEMA
ncbi:hypothetical protein H9P43_003478 [Blastocladiella emersonii ATCC 22665]|nr:hypothetical protein H9P43_003478 [Blastocladiella emersonii ATCC 22665]